MKVIRLDKNLRKIEELNGIYKDGVFKYKTDTVFGFLGQEHLKRIPYADTIELGKDKVMFTKFDGKNDVPLTFQELGKIAPQTKKPDSSMADFIREYKFVQLANKSMLNKPLSLKDILEILILLGILIGAALNYYSYQNLAVAANHITSIENLSQAQNAELIHIEQNQTQVNHYILVKLLNASGLS